MPISAECRQSGLVRPAIGSWHVPHGVAGAVQPERVGRASRAPKRRVGGRISGFCRRASVIIARRWATARAKKQPGGSPHPAVLTKEISLYQEPLAAGLRRRRNAGVIKAKAPKLMSTSVVGSGAFEVVPTICAPSEPGVLGAGGTYDPRVMV